MDDPGEDVPNQREQDIAREARQEFERLTGLKGKDSHTVFWIVAERLKNYRKEITPKEEFWGK